jgi:hypothetical protein
MKRNFLVTGVIILILLGVISYYRFHTKSFSPEAEVNFEADGLKVHIRYSRPFKKGRVIFGPPYKKDSVIFYPLVPYGKVWRTGANEATLFETNADLKFNGKILKAGSYSLWTIPGEQTWTLIFNSEHTGFLHSPLWGIDFNGEANREEKDDVMTIEVPAVTQDKVFEQFTISIEKVGEEMEMILLWDKTLVTLPFSR